MDYLNIPQIATSLTLNSDIQKLSNLHLSFTLHFLDLVGKYLPLILTPKDMLMKRRVSPSHSGLTPGVMAWRAISYHGQFNLLQIGCNLNSNRHVREVLQPKVVPFL
ncbi:hypothetical protein TNCV_2948761 [Trichonephila clavipes]|nr:hypothetical protein TNCV_2948761 [Trichonephila clavipes]